MLFTLVPSSESLDAEIRIDVSQNFTIALYNKVLIKIDSYPFQKYVIIKGGLYKLGHDVVSDPDSTKQGQVVYVERVT